MDLSLNSMTALKKTGAILFLALLFSFNGYAQSSKGTIDQPNKISKDTHKGSMEKSEKIQVDSESVQPVNENFKPGATQSFGGADTTIGKIVLPKVQMRENLFEESQYKEIPLKE